MIAAKKQAQADCTHTHTHTQCGQLLQIHKPIATTVQQFDEPDKWATSDNAKNTAMLFYATNVHLHNLAKDTAPRRNWHNDKSTELLARIPTIAPAQK